MPKGGKDKTNKAKASAEPYPKKVGKFTEEDDSPDTESQLCCDRCTSAVERLIQCEKCEMFLCSGCEKIPESVMAIIGEYTQVHWFYQYCDMLVRRAFGQTCTNEGLTNAVQGSLAETISRKLQSIEEKLKNLESTCGSLSNIVSHTQELDSPMTSPPHESRPHLPNVFRSTSEVLTSFINEEKERNKRRLNIIVHNIAESSAESGSERKSCDINNVTSIFDKYVGVKVKVTNANRIGRRKDDQSKPRLIKVSVESERDKAMLLRNCTKLRSKDNPEDIQKVYITPDLTPREQQQNKELRVQLAEKNKNGKKYLIKTAGL